MRIFAAAVLALCAPAWAASPSSALADLALEKVLRDAAPIFGIYNQTTRTNTSEWMKNIPDDTPIVRMNIPGT